jgi:hypothetical protein
VVRARRARAGAGAHDVFNIDLRARRYELQTYHASLLHLGCERNRLQQRDQSLQRCPLHSLAGRFCSSQCRAGFPKLRCRRPCASTQC